jgi:A/G-specific adenine glycosylase
MDVSSALQQWYAIQRRDLPWRNTNSPYLIWLSEIILQQTRVNQGIDYYRKFVAQYPGINELAQAPLDEVLKLWQGLGYYTRARNMHQTAKFVADELQGIFPATYEGLLKLPGIGKYSAAAIASLAYKEPVAVVDGNVYRVLARFYGMDQPISTGPGKAAFAARASQILDPGSPDIHNQAMMELGALVCLPRNPHCGECPLTVECVARSRGITDMLPVKSDKKKVRTRYFNYFLLRYQGQTWLRKRTEKDIWHSLYELPLIETERAVTVGDLWRMPAWRDRLGDLLPDSAVIPRLYKHQLTHQLLFCTFYYMVLSEDPHFPEHAYLQIKISDLSLYPVSRLIENYLAELKRDGLL